VSCESLAAAVLLAGCSDVARSESLRPYVQIQYINCTYRRSKMANCHEIWKLVRMLVLLHELFHVLYRRGKRDFLVLIFYCTPETGQYIKATTYKKKILPSDTPTHAQIQYTSNVFTARSACSENAATPAFI